MFLGLDYGTLGIGAKTRIKLVDTNSNIITWALLEHFNILWEIVTARFPYQKTFFEI